MSSTTLGEARAFCVEVLPGVSRTFALSIELLPEALREAVRVAYLLCRIVDTIEDDAKLSAADRQVLFDLFDRTLGEDATDARVLGRAGALLGAGDGVEHTLLVGAEQVFYVFRRLPERQRAAIRTSTAEMSRGMRAYAQRAVEDGGKLRVRDVPDLERYCYFVAGTVGELLTELFLDHNPELSWTLVRALRADAVSFGLGLQLVNIVKDVAEDATRDASFVPDSLLREHGISAEQLVDVASQERAQRVLHAMCGLAETHLAIAERYTLTWPAEASAVRLFCAVPLALALATLRVVRASASGPTLAETPKVSRELVWQVMARAGDGADKNAALELLFSDVRG